MRIIPEVNQEALSALTLSDLVAAHQFIHEKFNEMEYDQKTIADSYHLSLEMKALEKEIAKRMSNIFTY